MNSTRSPLTLVRRWSAGTVLAAALGVGVVGVHLADQAQATTTAAATAGSQGTSDGSSSSSSSSSPSSSSFGAVSGVTSGSGPSQSNSSGS
ncbi:MAG: hypothetical protein ABJA33_14645 [Pedococcus sp.]